MQVTQPRLYLTNANQLMFFLFLHSSSQLPRSPTALPERKESNDNSGKTVNSEQLRGLNVGESTSLRGEDGTGRRVTVNLASATKQDLTAASV